MVPDDATRWMLVRPRSLFEHPRLGRALARAFDDASEQALFERARRVGYDVRTVERALVAWSGPDTLFVGVGAFDTRRIESQLWERLLPPRERARRDGVIRVQGALGRDPVALAVWNDCATVLWSEGAAPAPAQAIDRALRPRDAGASDEAPMVLWHGHTLPAEVRARAPEAVLERVHDVELRVDEAERGVTLALRLEGELPRDASERVRSALEALAASPLGESIGAPRWMRSARVAAPGASALTLNVELPWAAVDALADVLRGRVAAAPAE